MVDLDNMATMLGVSTTEVVSEQMPAASNVSLGAIYHPLSCFDSTNALARSHLGSEEQKVDSVACRVLRVESRYANGRGGPPVAVVCGNNHCN